MIMQVFLLFLVLVVSAQAFDVKVSNHTSNDIPVLDRVVMAGREVVIVDYGSTWDELAYESPACGLKSIMITNRCHVVMTVCDPQVLEWRSEYDWFSSGWMLGVTIFGFYWLLGIIKKIVRVSPEDV